TSASFRRKSGRCLTPFHETLMNSPQNKRGPFTLRLVLLGLSLVSLVLCALGATAHYLKWALGNPWQPIGWLLSMLFLLLAFLPGPSGLRANFKSVIKPKTAFVLFWILFFVVAHLWNFRTAPWNGDGIFDD